MKEILKYQPEGFEYYTCDTPESAKNQERRSVFHKYLNKNFEGDAYENFGYPFSSKKIIDAKNRGYRSGYTSGRYDTLSDLIKFYSDIKPKLDAIDNQQTIDNKSVKTEEVTHA